MSGPNAELMAKYGSVVEKTADGTPFAAKMFFAMATMGLARRYAQQQADQRAQAQQLNMIFENLQGQSLQDTRQGFQYTRPPAFIAAPGTSDPNSFPNMPLGFDQGMVRMAAVAAEMGRELAGSEKRALSLPPMPTGAMSPAAAVKSFVGITQKAMGNPAALAGKLRPSGSLVTRHANALMGAAKAGVKPAVTLGALGVGALGLGAYAASKPVLGYLSKEQERPTYGAVAHGAPQLAYGVNSYGNPQLGSPFVQ